jgi:hypothetical protein
MHTHDTQLPKKFPALLYSLKFNYHAYMDPPMDSVMRQFNIVYVYLRDTF